MNELISDIISKEMKVGVFPTQESAWLDIGEWSEYRNAIKALSD